MSISTFEELKSTLSSIGCAFPYSADFLYRGLPDTSFKLIPSLFYKTHLTNPREIEESNLSNFIAKAQLKTGESENSKVWNNAFYARHWGLNLRLMDWTIHLGAALSFMLENPTKAESGALYVLPNYAFENVKDVSDSQYYDFNKTAILNPSFPLGDSAYIGFRNRFIQSGRFLVQDYKTAKECFYSLNAEIVTKIEIPHLYLKSIFEDCCKEHNDDHNKPFVLDYKNDPNYKLCISINNKIV